MQRLRVSLKERSYPILVGRNILSETGRLLKALSISRQTILIVSQKEIATFYQNPLTESLTKEGFEVFWYLAPFSRSSEAAKSQGVFLKLLRRIASCAGQHKSLFLIAFGGGVIGDLTGFAASVYRRGIPYAQIPTTLTAQVDSAIGGKAGIDLPEGKNLLGSIYQPALVLSDTELLDSLPERHWSDGFAEVIKYGVIKDTALFSLLEKQGKEGLRRNKRLLEKAIVRCARIKAKIVEQDELDKKGIRIVLNFGHTTGHAIETASRFSRQVTHGEAVAIGMLVACDIGRELGVLRDRHLSHRLETVLMKFGLPLFYKGIPEEQILKAMGYDKKSEGGANCFVLPVSLGKTVVVREVPQAVILQAVQKRRS